MPAFKRDPGPGRFMEADDRFGDGYGVDFGADADASVKHNSSTNGLDISIPDGTASSLRVMIGTTEAIGVTGTAGRQRVTLGLPVDSAGGASRTERIEYYYDFLGAAGSTLPAPWATQDTSAAGSPTLDFVTASLGGDFTLTSDSQSEAQNLTLFWNDALAIDPTKNPVFECRFKINFAGAAFSADQRAVIGLGSNRDATLDDMVRNAWFRIDGASLNILVEADDGATDTDDQDSTIDLVDDTFVIVRIDMADLSDIKFYVDDVEQGGATVAAAAMSGGMQPFIEIQRDAGTEVEALVVDYVKVVVDR
jgi:hypothetical protein